MLFFQLELLPACFNVSAHVNMLAWVHNLTGEATKFKVNFNFDWICNAFQQQQFVWYSEYCQVGEYFHRPWYALYTVYCGMTVVYICIVCFFPPEL